MTVRWRGTAPSTGLVLLLMALSGCHFESRFPDGNQRDDAALASLTTNFYRAIARHDTVAVAQVTFGAATVLLSAGGSPPALIASKSLMTIPERRAATAGIRIVRTEIRTDGLFATVRSFITAQDLPGAGGGEFEASDLITLAKRGNDWRIAHIQMGPWRPRSAP